MSGESAEQRAVVPLTKRSGEGKLYERRPDVEAQLLEIAALPQKEIFSRLSFPNRETPGYLYDETLVYLARQAHVNGDEAAVEQIYIEINKRFWVLIRKSSKRCEDPNDLQDFGQDVEYVLISKIFDTNSDKGDFAQINFGSFIVRELKSRLKGYNKRRKIERDFEKIDEPTENSHGFQVPAKGFNDLEMQELKQILNGFPENIREAVILHYLEGWQIESQDENEPTVCRKLNVSSRTIRNWFKEVRIKLEENKGGER